MFLKVLLTATSTRNSSITTSRLLRINIMDLDDNLPVFYRETSSTPATFVLASDNKAGDSVGMVRAVDADSDENSKFRYYITEGNDEGIFKIGKDNGKISLMKAVPAYQRKEHLLTVLASPIMTHNFRPSLRYDPRNMSFIQVLVKPEPEMELHTPQIDDEINDIIRVKNNSIINAGSRPAVLHFKDGLLERAEQGDHIRYSLEEAKFKPRGKAEEVSAATDELVVDKMTGQVRVNPALADRGEGIYKVKTLMKKDGSPTVARLVSYVHVVEDTSKLRFIFNSPIDVMEKKVQRFIKTVGDKTFEATNGDLQLSFSQLEESKDGERSFICFHATKNGDIVERDQALQKLKDNSYQLRGTVYEQFSVEDIQPCAERVVTAGKTTVVEWVLFVFAAVLAALILLVIICYLCFVNKYKKYMLKNQQYSSVQPSAAGVRSPVPKFLQSEDKQYEWKEASVTSQAFG